MNFSCWKCADDGCLGTMVSLLIGLLYASLQLPLDNRENKHSRNVCLSQICENIFPRKFLLIEYLLLKHLTGVDCILTQKIKEYWRMEFSFTWHQWGQVSHHCQYTFTSAWHKEIYLAIRPKKINSLSQLPLAKKLCAVLFFFFFTKISYALWNFFIFFLIELAL